jgi:hypothetical protein
MSSNVIKNTEIIKKTTEDCIKLIDENRQTIPNAHDIEKQFRGYLTEEYLSMDAVRSLKGEIITNLSSH